MARINFNYEKRQKELARQKKKEEKRQRKQNKNNPESPEQSTVAVTEENAAGTPPAPTDQSQ
ncbi:hypothetical protein ACHHRT_06090 [Desulfurivibrio sp. D14AmB]|uniref:hypothetical protein n=1 Tax=Desulfurivibrio sp. D14AmB TaxID=3374370 RepID=UPI00376EEBD6